MLLLHVKPKTHAFSYAEMHTSVHIRVRKCARIHLSARRGSVHFFLLCFVFLCVNKTKRIYIYMLIRVCVCVNERVDGSTGSSVSCLFSLFLFSSRLPAQKKRTVGKGALVVGGHMLRRRGVQTSSVGAIVAERLAAFEPHHLPALLTGLNADEVSELVPEDLSFMDRPARPKSKPTQVLLMLCLNIGSNPPDYQRIEPCARLECWIDPHVAQLNHFAVEGGSESIADALGQQYHLQQRDAVIKKMVEVHLEEAKQAMLSVRRKAEKGKIVLHYNGHGMPRATSLGEIWFFNKDRTHYVPLNIAEIAQLLESPTVYVLDCNSAGSILQHWYKERLHETRPHDMFICACSSGSFLPLNPQLPADVLTSCLTTPLRMALEWYVNYSHRKHLLPHVTAEMIRNIPGELSYRKTPLGELSWILVAVTDTIAWCTCSLSQFYHLFRQDTMTKALFRNFLLADRLLREVGCVPVTHPPIAQEAHLHHMWDLWDHTLESVICQLPDLLTSDMTINPSYTYKPSSFFTDQLTAFEVWVESGDLREQPEELPSVLLALTQISYRVPALTLLVKYLDSGVVAGKRAILCGILPYAGKLLVQTPEVFLIVSVLWMQVVRVDMNQGISELLKSRLDKHFIRLLQLNEKNTKVVTVEDGRTVASYVSNIGGAGFCYQRTDGSPTLLMDGVDIVGNGGNTQNAETQYYLMKDVDLHRCKAMACYVLCQILRCGGEYQSVACWNNDLLNATFACLASPNAEVRSWSCLLLAQLFSSLRYAKNFASLECTTRLDLFTCLLQDKSPIVRSSCVTLLASLIGLRFDELPIEQHVRRVQMEKSLLIKLRDFIFDASVNVREELIYFACQVLFHYGSLVSFSCPTPTASVSSAQFMEYMKCVGKETPKWTLDEPDVQVKSQLSTSRPTDNSRFYHSVVFATGTFLARDIPEPPSTRLNMSVIHPEALVDLQGMVHDAALVLFVLYQTCDTSKVTSAINALGSGISPQSHRFANEALRSMSRVVSTDSLHFVSEADRARSTRNVDTMRQLVLDLQDRKLGVLPSPGDKTRVLRAEGVSAGVEDGWGSSTTTTRHQVLPSLIPGDQVICATFRALEPEMVVATKKQRIYRTSYESYSSQEQIHSFAVRLAAPLHDVLVINDLSEHAGLLLVHKRGGFSLVRGCWEEMQGIPTEVATFSACPPKRTLDLKSAYRSYNANLFYGGAIGSNGETEIHILSLDEEHVIQRLEVSGNPSLTSLTAHTTGRAVFAGSSDGVVRYYDDRHKQGFLGAVGLLHPKAYSSSLPLPPPPATPPPASLSFSSTASSTLLSSLMAPSSPVPSAESIVGAGPVEGGSTAALMIATASRSAVRVYDSRKLSEPSLEIKVGAICGYHGGWSSVTKPPFITAFSAGVHTGILGVLLSDGTYTALNMRGRLLLEKSIKVSGAQGPLLPGSCTAHPLRPFISVGGEMLCMH